MVSFDQIVHHTSRTLPLDPSLFFSSSLPIRTQNFQNQHHHHNQRVTRYLSINKSHLPIVTCGRFFETRQSPHFRDLSIVTRPFSFAISRFPSLSSSHNSSISTLHLPIAIASSIVNHHSSVIILPSVFRQSSNKDCQLAVPSTGLLLLAARKLSWIHKSESNTHTHTH